MPDLGDTRVRDALQGLRLPDGTLLVATDRLSGLGVDGQGQRRRQRGHAVGKFDGHR